MPTQADLLPAILAVLKPKSVFLGLHGRGALLGIEPMPQSAPLVDGEVS
jgi:hypothetical protein